MPEPEHRRFRLTPLAYMKGRRVKRRLLFVGYCTALVMLFVGIVAICGMIAFVCHFQPLIDRANEGRIDLVWMLRLCICIGIPVLATKATQWMLRWFFLRIGLMTEEEGRHFFFSAQWPIEWTEAIDNRDSPSAEHSDEQADNAG